MRAAAGDEGGSEINTGHLLDNDSVRRVQQALINAGSSSRVISLASTARSAEDAAASIGVDLGSIVKSLVFVIGDQAVMALVSGDRRCVERALPGVLGLQGKVRRADAELVRKETGFAIGGVAPVGLSRPCPVAIDTGLRRFATVYAAAGHPHCVFSTSVEELQKLTGGTLSEAIAKDP
ncbi:MAG: YbaK/EbsC family protein [Rhodospirillales bacterium]|nr:YbaK/EbsC family protein [Rhodospirillales bacterium]